MKRSIPFVLCALAATACAAHRLPEPTMRLTQTEWLHEIAETGGYTQGLPSSIQLVRDGSAALFLRSGPRDRTTRLYLFDMKTGVTRELASAQSLLGAEEEKLSPEEKARRERQRVIARGIAGYVLSADGANVLVPSSGMLFVVEVATGKAAKLEKISGATDAKFSPDGKFVSYVKDHEVWLCEWRSGETRALTAGGSEDVSHGEAEFAAQEEMGRFTGYWWSPDSQSIAWQESDTRGVKRAFIADPVNPAAPPESFPYPFAGTENAKARLAVQSIARGSKPVWVEWDHAAFEYLAGVTWKNGPLTLLVQARSQREERLLAADALSGKTTELLVERDDAWIDLDQEFPHFLASGEFLWKTQADGEWRLQLRAKDGALVRVLNPGSGFRLRDLLHVDAARGMVVVSGSDDAPQEHVYELPLAGGAAKKLTGGAGTFARHYAEASGAFVETFSSLKTQRTATAIRADGTPAGLLPSEAAKPPFLPSVERVKAGEFDAQIVRPRGFLAGKGYPVLDFVYGGPSDGTVHDTLDGNFLWRAQWYAEQGFIVVTADNRGITTRGRAWETAIQGDFGTVPLEDQIAAIRALGAKYNELDLGRVGITGWSYGGYLSALAVCRRGDFFKAGVAGAPVTDWADYDTHYTERYIGTPAANAAAYQKSSVLTFAKGLERPLLIFHGSADDNVYFVHALKLADELFKAGKRFEFVPITGQTHMAIRLPESASLIDVRSASFFKEALDAD